MFHRGGFDNKLEEMDFKRPFACGDKTHRAMKL